METVTVTIQTATIQTPSSTITPNDQMLTLTAMATIKKPGLTSLMVASTMQATAQQTASVASTPIATVTAMLPRPGWLIRLDWQIATPTNPPNGKTQTKTAAATTQTV